MLKQTNKKVNEQTKQTHRYTEQSSAYPRGRVEREVETGKWIHCMVTDGK